MWNEVWGFYWSGDLHRGALIYGAYCPVEVCKCLRGNCHLYQKGYSRRLKSAVSSQRFATTVPSLFGAGGM